MASGGTTVLIFSWHHQVSLIRSPVPFPILPFASIAAVRPHQSGHRHSEEHRPFLAAKVLQERRRFRRRRASTGHRAELPQASAVPERQRRRTSPARWTGLAGAEHEPCRWESRRTTLLTPGNSLVFFAGQFVVLTTFSSLLSCTEPGTSRASLNFQEYVLSRPPLSRSHLFPPLDSSPSLGMSSSLLAQPSTSSAPGPFSTGFSLVKEIKDNLSQHEDDNISTTSGFSSRASDKGTPACVYPLKRMRESLHVAQCCNIVRADLMHRVSRWWLRSLQDWLFSICQPMPIMRWYSSCCVSCADFGLF